MKVTNQNIPPSILAAYKKLVANKPADALLRAVLRSTKKAHKPKKKKLPSLATRDIEIAVDYLIAYLTATNGAAPAPSFRADQIDKLKRGIFDPDYWHECTVDTDDFLESFPTDVPYTGGRPYAYPDPTNQPTRATYPDGATTAGPAMYEGATSGTYFHDMRLKWRRIVWKLQNTFQPESKEPAFIQMQGTITATASTRGSRAMISMISKWWLVTNASAQPATLAAPTLKPKQTFWRYRMPTTAAPYWNHTQQIKAQYSARVAKYTDSIGTISKLVMLLAPMPMMGYRYNNNVSVASQLNATATLWQIKKALQSFVLGTSTNAAFESHAFVWDGNVMADLGTLGGTNSNPKAISDDGKIIVGLASNAANQSHAFRWENGVMTDLGTFGGTTSNANDTSANGLIVVGYAQNAGAVSRAFRWENGVMTDVGTLGGAYASALFISADGTTITGAAATAANQQHAFHYENGIMTDLGTFGGATSYPYGITPDGITIVGTAQIPSTAGHAFRWAAGSLLDLGTLGGSDSVAKCVSDDGTIVAGQSRNAANQNHAFRWENGVMTDLGTLGGTTSDAVAMSSNGLVIVGTARNTAGQNRGFRWENGVMTDLGTLGGTASAALAVSKNGLIVVGNARTTTGETHAFMWENGIMTDLGTLGGTYSGATIINT